MRLFLCGLVALFIFSLVPFTSFAEEQMYDTSQLQVIHAKEAAETLKQIREDNQKMIALLEQIKDLLVQNIELTREQTRVLKESSQK